MVIENSLKIALRSMLANKSRTFLTALGMMIGVMSIVIVFSAGEGIKSLLVAQVESFGTNIIQVETKVPSTKSNGSLGVNITSLKLEDINDVSRLFNVKDVYGAVLSQENVSVGNELRKATLFGVGASYIDIDQSEVEYGRFFYDEEDRGLIEVAVLGSEMKEKLFGESEAIGKMIKIRQEKFLVIGVMKERGASFGMDFDSSVYVPLRTLQKKLMGIDHLAYFVAQIENNNLAYDTAEDIRSILTQNHDISDPEKEDFRISTMEDMMDILNTVTGAITALLLAIVAISLLVGGVGVLNVMYVIVGERTGEIGLRKAVGANFKDIMYQFLVESVMITMVGAVLGTILGLLISFLISVGAQYAGLDWDFIVPLEAFITVFFFSFVFGIFFGVYPARTAAKMDPIEALRKD